MLLECDDGTFGTNCRILCGHCHKGQSCDKETGACPRGCEPGYEGIYCNKSKIALTLFCVFFFSFLAPYLNIVVCHLGFIVFNISDQNLNRNLESVEAIFFVKIIFLLHFVLIF